MGSIVQLRYLLKKSKLARRMILAINDQLPLEVKDTLFRRLVNPYSDAEEKNRVIFIHVPKTAGNSIFQTLFDANPQGHKEALWYRKFDALRFDEYYKFGFVRNPWDRFVSAYFYLKHGGMGRYDCDFRDKYLCKVNSFSEFVKAMGDDSGYRKKIMNWVHFKPQATFLCDENGRVLVDYIGAYENLDGCYSELCRNIGLERNGELKMINRSVREDYRKYYSESGVDCIRTLYQEDINMFAYEF